MVQAGVGGLMACGIFSLNALSSLVPTEYHLNAIVLLLITSIPLRSQRTYWDNSLQQDNAPSSNHVKLVLK